jgi:uncharacterized SAM-binding protein YcdF (DUF218 family)
MVTLSGGSSAIPAPAPETSSLTPRKPRAPRHRSFWGELWRWGVTAVWFSIIAALVAGAVLFLAIYRQARTDSARPAQAIVVLGTAQFNGWPGPVFQARLDHALELWREGFAPLLVVTGGKMPADGYTEAEAAWAYLTNAGVPSDAIVMENAATDTWESMQGVAAILEPMGIDDVILVSDGFHIFRSRLMARDVGLHATGSPAEKSPIRVGGGGELSYMLREAAGVVAHLWETRIDPGGTVAASGA